MNEENAVMGVLRGFLSINPDSYPAAETATDEDIDALFAEMIVWATNEDIDALFADFDT